VKPEALRIAEARDLGQRIDDARDRGTRGANDHEGQLAVTAIFGHAVLERVDIHFQIGVSDYNAQIAAAQTGHVRYLVEPVMSLFCEVDDGIACEMSKTALAVFREGPRKGDYDCGEICL
jgi:hypothetical protein